MTTAAATLQTSVHCAACGRTLDDEISQQIGLGPDCRQQLGWRRISSLDDAHAAYAKHLVHQIADDVLRGDELRKAIFTLFEMGFQDLAKRVEQRVGKLTVLETVETVRAQAREASQPREASARPLPFEPTAHQHQALDAVRRIVKSQKPGVAFVIGYAGVGKTACIQFIAHEHGTPIVITPTGKAALRVRESTGLDAMTVHRWMYAPVEDPKTGLMTFKRRDNDIPVPKNRIIVLDEASMLGPDLWADIFTICQQWSLKLVVIGDGFQLPPVVPPNTPPFSVLAPGFAQQLATARIPVERAELTEVLRQAEGSPIIRASMMLRQGAGWSALRELPTVTPDIFWQVAHGVYQQKGITICHRNVSRQKINAGMRHMLGLQDEMPQPGEPLVCLKNTYEAGLVNGETFQFPGWTITPDGYETVKDRWKGTEENTRFGGITLEGMSVALSVEELHGRLQSGHKPMQNAAKTWARFAHFYAGDDVAPYVSANFAYGWTCHKCVHPDTLVETRHGLQRIRDIAPEGEIATAAGRQPYRALVTNPPGKMLRVTTKDGYALDVTPDHGVFVWDGADYARVEARNIQPGAFVRLALGQKFVTPLKAPVLPPEPEADVRATRYAFPARLTEDIAELLGLLVADGTVTERGLLRLTKRHPEAVARFAVLCETIFSLTVRVTPNYNGTHAYCGEANAQHIADWLRVIGGTSPNDKYVPPVILQAPLNFQARFLRGLFEDGTVNAKSGIMDHIEWSNRSDAVAGTVQTMLLRFGIIAGRRTRRSNGHTLTSLYIYGQNAKRFGSLIGFVSNLKNARTALPTGRETRYVAPFSAAERAAVWSLLSESEKNNLRTAGTMSRDRMEIVIGRTIEGDARTRVFDSKLAWHHTRVATVEVIEDAVSMCVEVPSCGRFLQNGFDGSNSQGSQWPYVLVVLESSVRLNEEEGRRWAYTGLTRAETGAAIYPGNV